LRKRPGISRASVKKAARLELAHLLAVPVLLRCKDYFQARKLYECLSPSSVARIMYVLVQDIAAFSTFCAKAKPY
jgi:hypothetical protein